MIIAVMPPCCDLHGPLCEWPDLCCESCTESRHLAWTDEAGFWRYGHPLGEECASPILSASVVLCAARDRPQRA